ncbi:MAG: YHS domain-containing protein, partial [Hyphomicrobium sp.]
MTTHSAHSHTHGAGHDAHAVLGVKDPVCGMTVDPHTSKHRHTHEGHPYHFCSGKCREKFIAEPAKYLKPETKPAGAVPAGTIYT